MRWILLCALALGACTKDQAVGWGQAIGAVNQGVYGGQPYYTGANRPVTCQSVGGYTQCR